MHPAINRSRYGRLEHSELIQAKKETLAAGIHPRSQIALFAVSLPPLSVSRLLQPSHLHLPRQQGHAAISRL